MATCTVFVAADYPTKTQNKKRLILIINPLKWGLLMRNAIPKLSEAVCSPLTALIGFMHVFLTTYLLTKMTVRKAHQSCIYHTRTRSYSKYPFFSFQPVTRP